MRISVSAPGNSLKDHQIESINKDLEKIDRRLNGRPNVSADVRVGAPQGASGFQVTLELDYGRNHLIAKSAHADLGSAVRDAREDILRQINNRSRGGHSSFVKGR